MTITGVSRSTWHYRSTPRPQVQDPVLQADRGYRSRIGAVDRAAIMARIEAGWRAGHSVDHSFAACWDEGVMLASRRSWWRIAAQIQDQTSRPVIATRASPPPRAAPVLEATGPNQVWSWDITDLSSPFRGRSWKAYSIIDIFSRKLVGSRVEDREADHLAVDMFATAITEHGAPTAVHADSGPAMRSNALRDFLTEHGISITHNRPRVSNDNPFSESEFRTMKYRPNYPRTFDSLDHARAYVIDYVPWYNQQHRHTGLALFTPDSVHNGSWHDTWTIRDTASQAYYETHPERFHHHRPTTPTPATTVGINQAKNTAARLQTA